MMGYFYEINEKSSFRDFATAWGEMKGENSRKQDRKICHGMSKSVMHNHKFREVCLVWLYNWILKPLIVWKLV